VRSSDCKKLADHSEADRRALWRDRVFLSHAEHQEAYLPELPEVETVRRGLQPALEGARIVSAQVRRPDLRFPFPPGLQAMLTGARITALTRRAKYLLIELDGGTSLIAHLGMSGSYRVEPLRQAVIPAGNGAGEDEVPLGQAVVPAGNGAGQQKSVPERPLAGPESFLPGIFHHQRATLGLHDHLVLDVEGGAMGAARVIYNDPRRFGFVLAAPTAQLFEHPFLAELGPEPLGNALSAPYLATRFAGKKAPLKAALLDQKNIAGLGNIYVCEALSRARLSPRRQAQTLVRADGRPTARLERLIEVIREVIAQAIEAGGSSLRDHRQTDGSLGYFQHRFGVYDRQDAPCPTPACRGTVKRIVQSGRSTFYCPACQR
jgi:formamidopyrimidine-DNA glycosylase